MAFEVGTGGGRTVTVQEPTRGQFDDNLGGALQFGSAHVVYKILEGMGGAIGAFAAGILVEFLDRIEPSLVKYAAPLIDMMLELEELDPHLRTFFEQLRAPTDAGGAAALAGIAAQAGGAGLTSLLSVLTAYPAQQMMAAFRPTLPGVADSMTMWRRGEITWEDAAKNLAYLGYKDERITAYGEITKARAGVGELITARFRGVITQDQYEAKMQAHGFDTDELNLYLETATQLTDAGAAMALYRRGEIDRPGFLAKLAQLGFHADAMVDLENLKDLIPGPTDLVRMGLREAWDDRVAAQWGYDQDFPEDFAVWMEKQGYSRDWSQRYWRAHWVLPGVTQGFQMFHRGIITEAELQELLRISDIPAKWRENIVKVAYKPYTRVDVRRMHDMGILTDAQLKTSYMDLGYDDEKAEGMTQFTIAYNDKTGSGTATKYKDLTRSVVIQAYRKGVLTREQSETRLMDLEYATEEIAVLLELADWTQEIEDAPDYSKEYHRDIKSIVEKAYGQRVISHDDAVGMLVGVGLTGTDAEYTLLAVDFWWGMEQSAEVLKTIGEAYVRRGINRADALDGLGQFGISSDMMQQKMAEWDVQRNIRSRRLTESQYRKALSSNLISVAEYKENMRGLGYTEYDLWILTAMAAGVEDAGNPPESGPLSLNER